jgi:transcriptional regulator with XRE-family HTH domain
MAERISNIKLGELLGLSHASVSRIRSGSRLPSSEVMLEIKKLTGWTVDEQLEARNEGRYAELFDATFDAYADSLPIPVPSQRSGE